MSKPIVICLCDLTGIFAEPWASAGYECFCVDTAHSIRRPKRVGNINYVWGDARSWMPPEGREIAFVACWPPCTHIAGSDAQDFKTKGLRYLTDALDIFNGCMHAAAWSGAPYLIENPVGVLSTHHRKPDYTFDPCDYAGYLPDPSSEAYTKRTCVWAGGGFVMPERRAVAPTLGSKMHLMAPSDERADLRSATPRGFALAVFQANSPKAVERICA